MRLFSEGVRRICWAALLSVSLGACTDPVADADSLQAILDDHWDNAMAEQIFFRMPGV